MTPGLLPVCCRRFGSPATWGVRVVRPELNDASPKSRGHARERLAFLPCTCVFAPGQLGPREPRPTLRGVEPRETSWLWSSLSFWVFA